MKVKIKKLHPDAVIPTYAKPGDAGLDLTAVTKTTDEHGNIVYGTGLAFEVPNGFFMMLVPRSSNSKKDLVLTNHCGIVDSGYRGEVMFKYAKYQRFSGIDLDTNESLYSTEKSFNEKLLNYKVGERIGQLIILPYPPVEFEEVEVLSETERGTGGYGSTGN